MLQVLLTEHELLLEVEEKLAQTMKAAAGRGVDGWLRDPMEQVLVAQIDMVEVWKKEVVSSVEVSAGGLFAPWMETVLSQEQSPLQMGCLRWRQLQSLLAPEVSWQAESRAVLKESGWLSLWGWSSSSSRSEELVSLLDNDTGRVLHLFVCDTDHKPVSRHHKACGPRYKAYSGSLCTYWADEGPSSRELTKTGVCGFAEMSRSMVAVVAKCEVEESVLYGKDGLLFVQQDYTRLVSWQFIFHLR